MTILEKIHKLLDNKTGLNLYDEYSTNPNKFVTKIIYSALSSDITFYVEGSNDKLTYNLLDDFPYHKLKATDEINTEIIRDDSIEFPVEEWSKKWNEDGKGKSRYGISLTQQYNSLSEDLIPSEYKDIKGGSYCIHCGRNVLTIQREYEHISGHAYTEIGKTCLCLKSELKKEFEYKINILNKEFEEKKEKLSEDYPLFGVNKEKMLEIKIRKLQRELEYERKNEYKDYE